MPFFIFLCWGGGGGLLDLLAGEEEIPIKSPTRSELCVGYVLSVCFIIVCIIGISDVSSSCDSM